MDISNEDDFILQFSINNLVFQEQNTVESSTFGAEFVALRITTDSIVSFRYKLRIIGVPIEGEINVFLNINPQSKHVLQNRQTNQIYKQTQNYQLSLLGLVNPINST